VLVKALQQFPAGHIGQTSVGNQRVELASINFAAGAGGADPGKDGYDRVQIVGRDLINAPKHVQRKAITPDELAWRNFFLASAGFRQAQSDVLYLTESQLRGCASR
jgi:hypothetical protein